MYQKKKKKKKKQPKKNLILYNVLPGSSMYLNPFYTMGETQSSNLDSHTESLLQLLSFYFSHKGVWGAVCGRLTQFSHL